MPSSKTLFKTSGIILVIALILLLIGWLLGLRAVAPEMINENAAIEESQESEEQLETINASSSVDSDMDAYLKSSNSVPNPNDFNDSYSDFD